MHPKDKICDLVGLAGLCWIARQNNQTVVLTSGCFDLLHGGHLEYIWDAGQMGFLAVGINSDAFVMRLKGPGRPIRRQEDRAFTMAGFYPVRLVAVFNDDLELIRAVSPAIYVASSTSHVRIHDDPPRVRLLESLGCRIVELGGKKQDSTTAMIRRGGLR